MKVLVCGGRGYEDEVELFAQLDALHAERPMSQVIQGGASGADRLAQAWAHRAGVQCLSFPAQWSTYGKAAGSKRNQQMLDEGKPDLVVAFPGGSGTADMVRRARAAGLSVIMFKGAKP